MLIYDCCFLFLLLLLSLTSVVESADWMFQSEERWDKEWKSGAWNYMDKIATERSRVAVIGGVLVQMYSRQNASVLDIGCGEGAISDFLGPSQQSTYVGLDISKEAIQNAKKIRGAPRKFVHSNLYAFKPQHTFDVIIFSDVLYYVEHEKALQQYRDLLSPNGIIIISIFHQTEKLMYDNIWTYARTHFTYLDEMEVQGYTTKGGAHGIKAQKREKTAFHIEVYRKKDLPS
jgi:2-polyprenyl-3-methyl-5-hydroxy-6-metoxy-1,4-benzoquinol methylase